MKKKILAGILAGIFALGSFSISDAMSREEISQIKVSKSGNFKYWEKNSAAKNALIEYVKDVTNKNSKNFIPIEDRIATFDMDGTFLCETAPSSLGYMFSLYTMLENPTPNMADEYREKAKTWFEEINSKKNVDDEFKKYVWKLFGGITDEEYKIRTEEFINTQNVVGLTNLKWGESFYLPMIEVISYLNANYFTVYVITGSERRTARAVIKEVVPVKLNHIIGCDIPVIWENLDGGKFFVSGDRFLLADNRSGSNTRINKIYSIKREIGKQPVLAFGNSTGDADMLNYTLNDNKYKSAAFFVICDDVERELGNLKRAVSDRNLAAENGWISISMHDDWKTIYGDNVKVAK